MVESYEKILDVDSSYDSIVEAEQSAKWSPSSSCYAHGRQGQGQRCRASVCQGFKELYVVTPPPPANNSRLEGVRRLDRSMGEVRRTDTAVGRRDAPNLLCSFSQKQVIATVAPTANQQLA